MAELGLEKVRLKNLNSKLKIKGGGFTKLLDYDVLRPVGKGK